MVFTKILNIVLANDSMIPVELKFILDLYFSFHIASPHPPYTQCPANPMLSCPHQRKRLHNHDIIYNMSSSSTVLPLGKLVPAPA